MSPSVRLETLCGLLLCGCLQPVLSSGGPPPRTEARDAGPARAASFCADFAAAYCEHSIRCGQTSSGGQAECQTWVEGNCAGDAASVALGYQRVDPALAAACLDPLRGPGLDCDPEVALAACDDVLSPAVDTGGSCRVTADCRELDDTCAGEGCTRSCRPAGELGEPCRRDSSCAFGFVCDWPSKTCVPPRPPGGVGADCSRLGQPECDEDTVCDARLTCEALPGANEPCGQGSRCAASAYCSAGTCRSRLGAGAACAVAGSCLGSLFCDGSCQPRKSAGDRCVGTAQCVSGLRCRAGTCALPGTPGQACGTTADCAEGLGCDRVLRTCEVYRTGLRAGEACTNDHWLCARRLGCKAVAPGAPGRCAPLEVGDACTLAWLPQCPAGAYCRSGGGLEGTCAPLAQRSVCSPTQSCPASQSCTPHVDGGFGCTRSKSAGESCSATDDCQWPLSCVPRPGSAPVCAPLGDVGAPCGYSKVLEPGCLFPLACIDSLCQHAGGPSEACLVGAQCLSGACNPDTFVCEARLPVGARCGSLDSACASGTCADGVCVASCP